MIDEVDLDIACGGKYSVDVPDWMEQGQSESGWTVEDIVRMVREDRDEH
jgi:hypothetical protein